MLPEPQESPVPVWTSMVSPASELGTFPVSMATFHSVSELTVFCSSSAGDAWVASVSALRYMGVVPS